MAAPLGNRFWEVRSTHGRSKIFETPDILWQAACEYFKWNEDNPLYETKAFAFQGDVTTEKIPLMRAMTMAALCRFLDVNTQFFKTFKTRCRDENNEDFLTIISKIEEVIYSQKFEGASANLLNANIIARDLGLRDTQEIGGINGGPISTSLQIIHVTSAIPIAASEEEVELIRINKNHQNNEDEIEEF